MNSVRLRLPALLRLLVELKPDIVALQELKCPTELFPSAELGAAGYPHQAVVGMKAYNGVAILANQPLTTLPVQAWAGREDARQISVRLPTGLTLHNFYVPAGGDIPDASLNEKFAHKLAFLEQMQAWSGQQGGAPALLCGDLNIAPLPDDVWSHKQLQDVVSHTPQEVEALARVQTAGGWVDSARALRPPPEKIYSWWSYRAPDWQKSNRGRRLDHIWLSGRAEQKLQTAEVFVQARGWDQPSDHAPVWVDLA